MTVERHDDHTTAGEAVTPEPGDELWIGPEASVQFAERFAFRVITVDPRPTYHGWVWLTGYQLDARGDALDRRIIFVQLLGLRRVARRPRRR